MREGPCNARAQGSGKKIEKIARLLGSLGRLMHGDARVEEVPGLGLKVTLPPSRRH
jgi:hypothetical protein